MINLEKQYLEIVKNILKKYPYTFYIFGSRTKGKAKKLSDLDLCFMDNIPLHTKAIIEEEFAESNLPFKVDLMDWNQLPLTFQNQIRNDLVILQKKEVS